MSSTPERLTKALDHYPPEVIKRALILRWAAANGVSEKELTQSVQVEPLLFARHNEPIPHALTTMLQHAFPACTLKHVEHVFELLIGRQKRQSHGTVYTPEYIIDYLLTHALRYGWQDKSQPPTLCDPACGAGGFLVRAAEILHRQHHFALPQIFAESLVGVDVDPWAIESAHIILDLYLLHNRVSPATVTVNLVQADALLTPLPDLLAQSKTPAGFDGPAGFDIVVTNPPYVKLQNLDVHYRDALLRAYADFAQGSFSLALLFLVRCHALLAAQGCAALITQNNLFTSLAGRGVRAYLQRERCVRRIVDFGHHKVFANASAYTCLVFLGREASADFAYASLAGASTGKDALHALPLAHVQIASLEAKKWRLAPPHHLANLQRIESTGIPLGQLAAIRVGFATLKDAVFVIKTGDEAGVDERAHYRVTVADQVYAIERGITQPALRVPDVATCAETTTSACRVIFPYHKVNGRYVLMTEDEVAHGYPGAYTYLLANRAALLNRDKRRKQYAGWYAWGRTQGMEAVGPKLLTKTFSKRPHFVLEHTDSLYCNGYGIFPRPIRAAQPYMPLEVLARVLNSRVMHYYAKLTSFQIEGNYQCYQKNFIERFGVPAWTAVEIDQAMAMPDAAFEERVATWYDITHAEIDEIVGAADNGEMV